MPYSQPSPSLRQSPSVKLFARDGVGVDTSEPVTVTAPFDARVIVRERGRNAWAIYSIVLANDRDGIPNTYQTIAETLDYSVRQVIRVVQQMEQSGYVSVEKGGGRSLPTTIKASLETVTLGVTSMSNSDTSVIDKTVTLGVTFPPTPPVVVVDVKQTTSPLTPQRPQPNGHEPILTRMNPADSTWLPLLGKKIQAVERNFGSLSAEFNRGMVKGILLDAESKVGAAPIDALMAGLESAHSALKRKLESEKAGGAKPIGNLQPYTVSLVVSKVQEAMQ